MGFGMSKDAKQFFNKVNEGKHGKFKTQFDFYYLCLIAGFINKTPDKYTGEEFVKDFTNEFMEHRELIIGCLIVTEISRNKIDKDNRERIERLMLKLVQPDSVTKLSSYGESLMNQYAENGYQRIRDEIEKPSSNFDTFLVRYFEKVLGNPD